MKTIGIVGASGWIGGHLAKVLLAKGYEVVGYSRSQREDDEITWRVWSGEGEIDLSGVEAVVNMAGEPVDQRWSEKRKRAFETSRVSLTRELCKAISDSEVKVLLNGSAIGFYGSRGDEVLDESSETGTGYFAELCRNWEGAVEVDERVRVAFLRVGMVLGKDGRAWQKMGPIFKLGIGGKLGNGQQWVPWIHLEDVLQGILFCLDNEVSGPVNFTAPEPVRNVTFTKAAGHALKRPTLFPAPAFMLKLVLGDFAEEGLLASARVVPKLLLDSGYSFRYAKIDEAMAEITS